MGDNQDDKADNEEIENDEPGRSDSGDPLGQPLRRERVKSPFSGEDDENEKADGKTEAVGRGVGIIRRLILMKGETSQKARIRKNAATTVPRIFSRVMFHVFILVTSLSLFRRSRSGIPSFIWHETARRRI